VTNIAFEAFYECDNFKVIYYKGTAKDWNKISVDNNNDNLTSATRYYYSETKPTTSGNYWHYVDGEVVVWGEDN
jgi:hypothetical protein